MILIQQCLRLHSYINTKNSDALFHAFILYQGNQISQKFISQLSECMNTINVPVFEFVYVLFEYMCLNELLGFASNFDHPLPVCFPSNKHRHYILIGDCYSNIDL